MLPSGLYLVPRGLRQAPQDLRQALFDVYLWDLHTFVTHWRGNAVPAELGTSLPSSITRLASIVCNPLSVLDPT